MFLAAPVEPVTFFLAATDSAAAAAGELADKDSIFYINGSLRLRIGRQTAVTCLTFRLPYIAVGGRLAARLDLGFILDANTVKGRVRRLQMFPLNN